MKLRFENYLLDTDSYSLTCDNRPVELEPKTLDLLTHLAQHHGKLISKDELIQTVWGGRIVSDAAIASAIKEARKALNDDGSQQRLIKTIHGRGYMFVGTLRTEKNADSYPNTQPQANLQSVAVLPFEDLNPNPDNAFFALGLCDEITTVISKISGLSVFSRGAALSQLVQGESAEELSRKLGADVVLYGSLRWNGNRVRVTATLSNVSNSQTLWADRYDRQVEDVFDLQDEITREIVGALQPALDQKMLSRARELSEGTNSYEAWQNAMRARHLLFKNDRTSTTEARALSQRSLALDPNYPAAHVALAFSAWKLLVNGWADDRYQELQLARVSLDRAGVPDSNHSDAATVHSFILMLEGKYEDAIKVSKRTLERNPKDPTSFSSCAFTNLHGGHYSKAIELALKSLELNQQRGVFAKNILASANLVLENYTAATQYAQQAIEEDNTFAISHVIQAIAYLHDHNTHQAKQALMGALEVDPALTIESIMSQSKYKDTKVQNRIREEALKLLRLNTNES